MHLWDYLGVIRNDWFAGLVVAGLVFGGIVARALLATPVYEASARLQVDLGRSSQDEFLSDLLIFGGSTYTGTEMEMMRSYTVARKAAEDRAALPVAIIRELHEYRPLDVFLRRFQDTRWTPCLLAVDPDHCPRPEASVTWLLEFDASGQRLILYDHPEARGRRVVIENARLGVRGGAKGTPFDAWGHSLSPDLLEGDPPGRTFVLRLRTPTAAARWIHAGTTVQEVGDWTGVIDVGFRASSPHVAARITDAVARSYTELKEKFKRERLDGTIGWLQGQIDTVRKDLGKAYGEKDEYVSSHGAALLSEQAQGIYDQQGALIRERFDLEQRLRDVDARLEGLSGNRRTEEYIVAIGASKVDSRTSALVTQKTDLEIQRAVLLNSGEATVENPQVAAIDAKMAGFSSCCC